MEKIYKALSNSIENLIKFDPKAKLLLEDLLSKPKYGTTSKGMVLHPFILYISSKLKSIHGENVMPKDIKRAIIYFYSKTVLGIDTEIW